MIPVNEPLLDGNEREYLIECVDTGWISSEGPFIKRFETEFARYVGRTHGVAVSNGTVAIDATIEALGIGVGDEVILPSFTIISCVMQIVRAGAIPVFVDCDPSTFNVRPEEVVQKITDRTRAIMIVHIYGLPVDADPILLAARARGIAVIEDAAEMIGQTYRDRPCGSLGDVSCFSFYPNKHVTTGEGGMVLTDDDSLAETVRSLRNLCFVPEKRFVHDRMGWNLRMTNMQAAIGVAQLERVQLFVERKRKIGSRYQQNLKDVVDIQLPVEKTDYAENIYWVFPIVIEKERGMLAKEAMQALGERGIGTRPFFYPLHQQPVLLDNGVVKRQSLPVSEGIYERGFYVPSGLALRDDQIDEVSEVLRSIFS